MTRALLIEDEEPAMLRLKRMIGELDPSMEIAGTLVSVKSTVEWLRRHPSPDLIFMDVQLADGSSFEVFRQVKVETPVIFVTAYDAFAVDAFKVNGIDYLLKPVKKEELQAALQRFISLYRQKDTDYSVLADLLTKKHTSYQKRLVLRYGDLIRTVEVSDAAYFYTEDKVQYVCTRQNLRYPLDSTLDQIQETLDPAQFFRINRQCIVNVSAIEKMVAFSKSRVRVYLDPPHAAETIVSSERSAAFKAWLTGSEAP
jgi:DNA-binding LytR/AlgR family response regulator